MLQNIINNKITFTTDVYNHEKVSFFLTARLFLEKNILVELMILRDMLMICFHPECFCA
jgi:hypothetical protein